jgi:CBS domain containing-hemolysin-like protein
MGSSISHTAWTAIALLCGLLFLIFDAARYFAQEVGPVTLRRWSGDPASRHGWFRFDPRNLRLVSGALLQMVLVGGVAATVRIFEDQSTAYACLIAAIIWILGAVAWKLVLGFVPDPAQEALLRGIIPLSHFFYIVFWPLLFPLRRAFERIEREEQEDQADEEPSDEDVQAFIDVGEDEGILEKSEGRMIQSVVEFGDRVARELMTPRIDMLAFDAKRPFAELARLFSESKYSRIPIYAESIDSITGIVHVKDVLDVVLRGEDRPVSELARPAYFVLETKKVSELLREFQSEHLQVAIVVDEFGGTAGIISIEDILEEIVGEISDEHEEEEATIVPLGEGEYLVSGLLRVDALEELLGVQLSGDDYETVAGLIVTTLGRIPKGGAVVKKNGFEFVVDRADRRRIYRVRVRKDPEWEQEAENEQ